MENLKKRVSVLKKLSWKKRLSFLGVLVILAGITYYFGFKNQKNPITYETATVTKGTLISSISGTGTITSVNSTDISSKVSGTVKNVFVSNGDVVTKNQKIAQIELDEYAQERQTSAWKSYLDAQEAVKTAQKNKSVADIEMWQAQKAIIDGEKDIDYKNNHATNPDTKEDYTQAEKAIIDKNLEKARLAFTEAETKYKNADSEISAAKAQVTAAWRDYQRNTATIVAPASGVVSNLNLATGMTVSSTSNSSNNNASENSIAAVAAQTVGKISDPKGSIIATVSLSEIDVIHVKAGQKVTLTLDAYEDQSFTGKVLAVNTTGSTNSSVTTYAVTIVLDPTELEIYSNMAVSANIITDIQSDVLLVPSTAIQSLNEQNIVQIMKDGVVSSVNVEIGTANDSETIITSGLSEGDVVVTATVNATQNKTKNTAATTSVFSGMSSGNTMRMTVIGGAGGPPPGGF